MRKKSPNFAAVIKRATYLALALMLLCSFTHKFYVSITQVDYEAEERSLQITSKLYTDDLEAAIEQQASEVELRLGTRKQAKDADVHIENYLRERFKLTVNGKATNWQWVGFEVEHDVTWCYMEASKVKQFKTIKVENSIFTEVYKDQANVVDVNRGSETQSLLLGRGSESAELSFE